MTRGRPLRTGAAIVALAATLLSGGCSRLRSRILIRQANEQFRAQEYDAALRLYKQAERLEPDEPKLKKFIAYSYMALYQPGSKHPKDVEAARQAINNFKAYLAVRPDDDRAAQLLVSIYMNADLLDEAIGYFKSYATTHPSDVRAVQSIAMLYAKQGDFDETVTWQKQYIAKLKAATWSDPKERDTKLAEAYYTLGVTCWQKSYDFPGATLPLDKRKPILDTGMEMLNQALALKPAYVDAMAYVNLLYRQYAKYETDPARQAEFTGKADEWLKKALAARSEQQQRERERRANKNPLEAM